MRHRVFEAPCMVKHTNCLHTTYPSIYIACYKPSIHREFAISIPDSRKLLTAVCSVRAVPFSFANVLLFLRNPGTIPPDKWCDVDTSEIPRYIFQGTSFWVYLSISFRVMFRINCTFHGSSPADRSLASGRQAWIPGYVVFFPPKAPQKQAILKVSQVQCMWYIIIRKNIKNVTLF